MRLNEKLRQLRKERRLNQDDVAAALSISRRSYGLYELGKTLPDAARLAQLGIFFQVSTDWLLSDDAAPDTGMGQKKELPLLGLAACSVAGWYKPQIVQGMSVPMPADELADGFVVTATGDSLLPEGVKPGYMCYCAPHLTAKAGDIVYIKEVSGRASMKVFRGRDAQWLTLDGYFPPDEMGAQARYTERRAMSQIVDIVPVMFIRRK